MEISASEIVSACAEQLKKLDFPWDIIVLAVVLVVPFIFLFMCLCYCIKFRRLKTRHSVLKRQNQIPLPPENFTLDIFEKVKLKENGKLDVGEEMKEMADDNKTSTPFVKKHDNFQQDLIKRVNSVKTDKSRSYDSEGELSRSRHQSANSPLRPNVTTPVPMPRARSKGDLTKSKNKSVIPDANNNPKNATEQLTFFVPMNTPKHAKQSNPKVIHSVIRPGAKSAMNNSYENEGTPKITHKRFSNSAENTPTHEISNRSGYGEMSLWEQHENRPVLKHTA